jgi:ABC-type enterochelin transport system ATPase subunit
MVRLAKRIERQLRRILSLVVLKYKAASARRDNDESTILFGYFGYLEGRFIAENIRLISDTLNFTVDQDI